MFSPLDAFFQSGIKADVLFLQAERIIHQFSDHQLNMMCGPAL